MTLKGGRAIWARLWEQLKVIHKSRLGGNAYAFSSCNASSSFSACCAFFMVAFRSGLQWQRPTGMAKREGDCVSELHIWSDGKARLGRSKP